MKSVSEDRKVFLSVIRDFVPKQRIIWQFMKILEMRNPFSYKGFQRIVSTRAK